MTTRTERLLIGGGILVVVALIGVTAYLGYRQVTNARIEDAAAATRVAGLAPTGTATAGPATAAPPTSSPTAGATAAATPVPSPTAQLAASPTVAATPSSPPATAAPATARPTEEGRYLGRDPLPPGIDLTNGPYLKEMKARGAKGVNVGDGGLGDELKAAYLAALQINEQAINTNDDSSLRQYFTGEELERLLRGIEKDRVDTRSLTSTVKYEARVMEFMPETTVPGAYEIVDARTETISTVRRLPDGKIGEVVKAGEPSRVCYSVQMTKEGGRWKVQSTEATQGGPQGGRCPPYWS